MTEPPRRGARPLALSFAQPLQAGQLLSAHGWWDPVANSPLGATGAGIVGALARTADPDAALAALAGLVGRFGELAVELAVDSALRTRLLAVLGVSATLAEHLHADPDGWRVLRPEFDLAGAPERLAAAVGADTDSPVRGAPGGHGAGGAPGGPGTGGSPTARPSVVDALRTAYRRELLAIAGRDLAGELPLREVIAALSDLAGATLQAALEVAATGLSSAAVPCRLAIIAMGKAGGRELNYVSDVDVIFVGEPEHADGDAEGALATATALAREVMHICRAVAWEVDAALRPEGKDGPLVRTLASHRTYYERWASTWEFQALLKARFVAGDPELGAAYQAAIAPLVWRAAERPEFVADVRAMRRRVVEHLPAAIAPREIKLGPGGLRDVEFAVQLLQLVHGRGDDTLRVADTLGALAALRDGGYVGRDDAPPLAAAYTFLRESEHRLQLRRLRRTHLVPEDDAGQEWLARALGFTPDASGSAREQWAAQWATHGREVRRLHEKLFFRPLLEAVARVPSEALRLSADEAGRRLTALGFADPAGALRHIEALTAGLSRRAALQRTLLPVLLSDFADAPDPDGGLLAYRRISEELGSTPWYLRLLRDEGTVASRLAHLLGTSKYVTRLLARAPDALPFLAADDALRPRDADEVATAMADAAVRQADPASGIAVVRALRRLELLRIAFADLLGRLDVEQVGAAVSGVAEATLRAALLLAVRSVTAERGVAGLPRFAVMAMGRLGGCEAGYGSDADVLFVYEDRPGGEDGAQAAAEIAGRLRALLATPSSNDPPMVVDADLRPEGRNGPLVRSLASYGQYYARWSEPWEAQALLRARQLAGDSELAARFLAIADPIRYPPDGLTRTQLTEIRRIKGRIDSERLPRGADPSTHLKLGRGGLGDVEWTVQLLQLQHAGAIAALRTTRTLAAVRAAGAAGLLSPQQADALADSWRAATRLRNAIVLVRDKLDDQLPTRGDLLLAIGRAVGYPAGVEPGQVLDDYRRTARHARAVVEDVFYGPRR
jgi:glutamate-ammonia-ligase adenylyltransferase